MLVFIDESGDPGFKVNRGSTAVFVAGLVAFREIEESRSTQECIDALAARLRIPGEFKFSKSRPAVRDAFFAAISPCDFRVRAIVVQKHRIYSTHLRTNKEAFYSFFVKTMLRFDNGLLQNAKIIIDGSGDREFKRELGVYLRRHLGSGCIRGVQFVNSETDRLVQLADMCTGSIARSYKPERSDANRWRDMIRDKIDDVWEFK